MATDFIMPRMPDQQQHPGLFQTPQSSQATAQASRASQWTQHQPQLWAPNQPRQELTPIYTTSHSRHQSTASSNQISPPLSTSGNGSPTSPKAYHTRQIRPLYMPAVLRPTEFPSKPPRSTPPASDEDDEERTLKSNSSFISLGSALTRLSRRSTGDSGKCVDGKWNLDLFPEPTGLPTREHWKSDREARVCDHSTCRTKFTYITRRHHCRRCGNIFCDAHSAFDIPLDQNANYNPRGTSVRACQHCYSQFKEWRTRTNSQDSTTGAGMRGSDAGTVRQIDVPSSPLSTSPDGIMATTQKARPEVALSVPRDWNWSTF